MKITTHISLLVLLASVVVTVHAQPFFTNPLTRIVNLNEEVSVGTLLQTNDGNPVDLSITNGDGFIEYSLSDPSGLFQISGVNLATASRVDRENPPAGVDFSGSMDIIVQLSYMDGGMTVVSNSTVTVRVTVLDINDNPPVWNSGQAIPDIQEAVLQTLSRYTIVVLDVSDADLGVNSFLTYTLISPLDQDIAVNNNGIVSFTSTIDSINEDLTIPISVMVSDSGNSPMTVQVDFSVTIRNTLEPPPVFSSTEFQISLLENDNGIPYANQEIVTVQVRHNQLSEGTNPIKIDLLIAPAGFSVTTTPSASAFTGEITFTGALDRELQPTVFLYLSATEVNPDDGTTATSFASIASVIITMADVNDNAPIFFNNAGQPEGDIPYEATVPESASIGHIVLDDAAAFDIDEGSNSVFLYGINPGQDLPFSINENSGIITVGSTLDFETAQSYSFTIFAREQETAERRSSTATVQVTVTNLNDNSPTFPHQIYAFQVEEGPPTGIALSGTADGETVMTVEATDLDIGMFGVISSYELLSAESSLPFSVSADGEIFVDSELDRETRMMYHMTLLATDTGGLTATTLLIITVLDVNDQAPTFIPDTFTLILIENTDYPSVITVLATDADQPNTINSQITYSISPTTYASVHPTTGAVSFTGLNHEIDSSLTLTVTATDAGTNPGLQTGTATINVLVQDMNEQSPVFDQFQYQAQIQEDLPVNSPIGVVASATDPEGHGIRYSVMNTMGGSFFSIDELTGVISLAHAVDSDPPNSLSMLMFQIQAEDDAVTPARSGLATVTVTIENVNDNMPVITNPPARDSTRMSIVEKTGTVVPSVLFTAEAIDNDVVDTLTFSLTGSSKFSINAMTGEVMLTSTLDRSQTPLEQFTINACDSGNLCDSVNIMVTVLDFNDNPPVFINDPYSRSISECLARADVSILTATAEDTMDEGDNAEIVYSLVTGSGFTINALTGEVRAVGDSWDFESGPTSFTGTIRATDNPSGAPQLTEDATFTVTLTDCNDNPPVFGSDGQYTVTITEAATSADNPILTVSVSDLDSSAAFQSVTYEIVGGTPQTNGWIDIDNNGNLNIVAGQTIDRENSFLQINSIGQGQMIFNIRAQNVAPGPSGSRLEDIATVTVLVTDTNDNDPVIQNPNMLSLSIVENALNDSIIAVISATDADYGDNAHILYSIVAGNTGNTFAINPENGHLTVAIQGNLDNEGTNMYTLTVRAENDVATSGGTPDEITVIISLIGTNDHSPIFEQAQYVNSLREFHALDMTDGAAVGSTVQTVHANDGDGPNTPAGQIEYRIVSGNTFNGETIFDITIPSQGSVFVVRPDLVDYEMITQFDIVIEAYDLVTPVSQRRQDSTHLIVNIVDVNDNLPVFANPSYSATIIEEQGVGTEAMVIPTIRATDADMGGLDPLEFRLESGNPFTISSDGTSVTTTARINREAITSYSAMVTVRDAGGHDVSAPLQIEVIDINDNAPRFLQTPAELEVNIPENLAIFPSPDGLIRRVEAVDDDIGNNAQITYLLSGGRGNFEIVSTTGQIRLIASLDRDSIASSYALNVTATDGALASWLVFNVIVDNINDNNPVFLEPLWEGTLDENAPVGSTVLSTDMTSQVATLLQIQAEDLDPESNVTYFLSPDSPTLSIPFQFTLDGYIVTTQALDREMNERYSFFVRATDGFRLSLDDALVEIVVGDVNDNRPMFEQPSYTSDLYELTPAGAIFLILQAADNDTGVNAEITYSITSIDPAFDDFLEIDEISGGLYPTREVSFQAGDPTVLTFEVTATDSGQSPMSTSVQVVLNLVDRNTEGPIFTEVLYRYSVSENELNAVVGNPIAMDSAEDQDTIITYSILTNNEGYENFRIDNETGELTTTVSLDREMTGLFTLTISAVDSAPLPRTGFATVVITVEDANDNDPYFDPASYPIAISESISIGSAASVIQVSAFDDDIGTNAQLSYEILSGDTSVFSIDGSTGEISTLPDQLDRETTDSYELIIQVTDSPQNVRTATAVVSITINDVNDNSPKFTGGAVLSSNPVEIYEDTESGFVLTDIDAFDPDFQLNGIVGFYFQNLTRTRGPFQIERETGVISLRSGNDGQLDREITDFYELTVIAADRRGLDLNIRTTTGLVRVNVLDINDNLPIFRSPPYEFTIPEGYPLNTPLGEVQGDDADIGPNAALYYHLVGEDRENTSCANQFCIDLLTGELTLVKPLDRETDDFHHLTVAVTNNMELKFNETTGTPIDASTASALVTVTDTNDQTPVFVESSLFAVVAEEADFGTTITVLEATDSDTLNGSIVWYEIVTPQVPYLVDRDTGVVTTAGIFTGLSGTLQEVTVRAFDNFGLLPTFSTMAIMRVQVFKSSEQVIITFSRDKETVESKINQIHAALTAVTNERITITEVRVERSDAGEVDISGTDVKFFALDSDSGIVINPAVIIRIIDENYALVEDLFTECRVERIGICSDPEAVANPVPVWLWVVLGVLGGAVICMCCCFLIGCVVEKRRSRRWKKKAKLGQNTGMDQFSHMADYNTNPLWVSPYDGLDYTTSTVSTASEQENSNPLYESQELTIEMFQDDGDDVSSRKSQERLVKAPPPPPPTISIAPTMHKRSDGLYDSQEIEIHLGGEELDGPDSESDVQLLASTPKGLKGKRGGKSRSHYPDDDELLAKALGRSYL